MTSPRRLLGELLASWPPPLRQGSRRWSWSQDTVAYAFLALLFPLVQPCHFKRHFKKRFPGPSDIQAQPFPLVLVSEKQPGLLSIRASHPHAGPSANGYVLRCLQTPRGRITSTATITRVFLQGPREH